MIQSVRCMHCGTKTKTVYQTVQSRNINYTIVLNNAPMHFCSKCADNLISLEALTTLRYIKTLPLKQGINQFDFDEMYVKASKVVI